CTYRSVCLSMWCLCLLFFQAEDGIRDSSVTGVQTCALPISIQLSKSASQRLNTLIRSMGVPPMALMHGRDGHATTGAQCLPTIRSEERRVGKECRSRRWRYHDKEKRNETGEEIQGHIKNNSR